MNANPKKHNTLEINDLIDRAVKNAVARRGLQADPDSLLTLSDCQEARVAGGLSFDIAVEENKEIIVAGFKPIDPPINVGMIYPPDYPFFEEA
jgi:hypothetical protein